MQVDAAAQQSIVPDRVKVDHAERQPFGHSPGHNIHALSAVSRANNEITPTATFIVSEKYHRHNYLSFS
ncbi:MAG: hypothetical protein II336_18210 [Loktanella sp.]|nr:hypothetical protein [Loktanella sp.]